MKKDIYTTRWRQGQNTIHSNVEHTYRQAAKPVTAVTEHTFDTDVLKEVWEYLSSSNSHH